MSFLEDVGKAVTGAAGVASGISALTGRSAKQMQAQLPSLSQARKTAGFRTLATPSFLVTAGARDPALFRTTQFDPAAMEADVRARMGGIAEGVAGLRGRTPQTREDIAALRTGLGTIRTRSGQLRQDVDALRAQVVPGFGRLTEARVKAIKDRRDEAIGNLRESMARRKVLGSSFAEDAITRAELTFAQEEEAARATSAVEEMALTGDLTQMSAGLLEMDANMLQREAQAIGLDMGLTQQDAGLFAQELGTIQAASASLVNTLNREFQELGIAANIAQGVNTSINQIASLNTEAALMQAQLAANAQKLIAGDVANLGESFETLGSGIQNIFG